MTPLCVSGLGNLTGRWGSVIRCPLHASIKDGRISVYQAAVLAPLRFPHSFIAHRLLSPCFLHLGYNLLSEMVLELMPCATRSCLMVWLRCRFFQAAIALFFDPSSVVLLLMLVVGFRVIASYFLCFVFYFAIILQTHRHCAQQCHHSVRHHSPALHPVFKQLVHTARSIVTPRRPGGSSGIYP